MKKIFFAAMAIFVSVSLAMSGSQQTSSTLASTIISDVRSDYGDATLNNFSAAEMLEYLNEGMVDLVNKSHCLEDTESVNLIADTIEYTLSTAFIEVLAVQYNDAGGAVYGLKKGDPSMVGLKSDEGDIDGPQFWYEFEGKVGIYPALSSVTTETCTVYLVKRPVDIASNAAITIPSIYETALKLYMLGRMALKDRNVEMYQAVMSQYSSELGFYRQDLQEKTK
jgi:hypothetical protein